MSILRARWQETGSRFNGDDGIQIRQYAGVILAFTVRDPTFWLCVVLTLVLALVTL